jgi:hypothetical protein
MTASIAVVSQGTPLRAVCDAAYQAIHRPQRRPFEPCVDWCRVLARCEGWSAVRARSAEAEPDFGAALENAPLVSEPVDDQQTPAALRARSRSGR